MLQRIRENVTGWVAWLVIIFLSIPFAFWGINQYFSDTSGGVAAEVNGTEIPLALLDRAYQNRYNELVRMFGGELPPGLIDERSLRREQLERLIMEEVLDQEAAALKLRVDDATLQQAIRQRPEFQVEGEFNRERYVTLLNYNNRTPASFEASYRRDLGLQQLQRGLGGSAFATSLETARALALGEQARRHEAVVIADERFHDAIELTDQQVEAYYADNQDRFLTEEKVDIAFVELNKADYEARMELSEEELREEYELRASDYAAQEDRVASHILIEGDGEEALARAQEVQAKLEAGEDFAALAKQYSDDPVSAEDGGSLGEIARGQLEGPFEDALFALEEGEVSEPVLTDFGYHIIRLDEIQAPELPEFDEIRDQLAADLKDRLVADQFENDVQQLADITFADDGSLEPAAQDFDLEIKRIEDVTRRGGEAIASNQEVRSVAFSDTVLGERRNSDVIRLDDGERVVVLRVTEHQPAEPKPLAEVEDQVRQQLLSDEATRRAEALASSLLERLQAGEALADIAAAEGLQYREPMLLVKSEQPESRRFAQALFTADYPLDGPTHDMVAIEDRDFMVFSLLEVVPGDASGLTSSELQQRRQLVERDVANSELGAYLAELRNSADVTIYEKNLKEDAPQQ